MAKAKTEVKMPKLTKDDKNVLKHHIGYGTDEIQELDTWAYGEDTAQDLEKKGLTHQLKREKGRFYSFKKHAKHWMIDQRIAYLEMRIENLRQLRKRVR